MAILTLQSTASKAQKWTEIILFYLCLPLVLALFLDPSNMWTVLLGATALGVFILFFQDSFSWKRLITGGINWMQVLAFTVIVFLIASFFCWLILPDRIWFLLREAPHFLPILLVGYSLILVLPQELLYRVLFFERYADLFSNERTAVFANAVIFAFGHLMYWHWVVFLFTFLGSFIFTHAYLRDSFPMAWALHTVAGFAIFASGLGWLFYSGGAVAQ